LKLIVDII